MTRLTLALAAWIGLVAVASASLTPRNERRPLEPRVPRAQAPKVAAEAAEYKAAPEFKVTEQTEILLDGKACRYEDVPQQATVLRMEVAPDRKTVLRIHFRTGK